jgi:hypothetical protein
MTGRAIRLALLAFLLGFLLGPAIGMTRFLIVAAQHGGI